MKLAVIGTGKTGGAVEQLARTRHEVATFTQENPPTVESLRGLEAAIVFVPAGGLADILPALVESGIPVVAGTTGFDYTLVPTVRAPWIHASNFSLGMNTMFLFSRLLQRLDRLAPNVSFSIHEVHHTSKKDSPSGTALRLQKLLPASTPVSADRVGDARGTHTLSVHLPGEVLRLEHEALDRSVFAEGALYAAEQLLAQAPAGVHAFEAILEEKLRKELL